MRSVRAVRSVARRAGLLEALDRSTTWWLRHLRTLFAIHDAEDLAALDLPWWTYRSTEAVNEFLEGREARVFEYGAGASTVWLARRARHVYSVEHDLQFVETLTDLVQHVDNVTILTVPPVPVDRGAPAVASRRRGHRGLDFRQYVEAIDDVEGDFDLIVIDGRARMACLRRALDRLAPGGLIVFDDIGRRRYRAALSLGGVSVDVLTGAKPCMPYPASTALLRADGGRSSAG